jgi:hypothetical protein
MIRTESAIIMASADTVKEAVLAGVEHAIDNGMSFTLTGVKAEAGMFVARFELQMSADMYPRVKKGLRVAPTRISPKPERDEAVPVEIEANPVCKNAFIVMVKAGLSTSTLASVERRIGIHNTLLLIQRISEEKEDRLERVNMDDYAVDKLFGLFVWDKTPEGTNFWSNLHDIARK